MPPEQVARAILRLALRHEQSLAASLDPAFAQENRGLLAQQCVENLLQGLIVLDGEQPPLSHDLERLQLLARIRQLRAELESLLAGADRPQPWSAAPGSCCFRAALVKASGNSFLA